MSLEGDDEDLREDYDRYVKSINEKAKEWYAIKKVNQE
jgi:hypothetical protein